MTQVNIKTTTRVTDKKGNNN